MFVNRFVDWLDEMKPEDRDEEVEKSSLVMKLERIAQRQKERSERKRMDRKNKGRRRKGKYKKRDRDMVIFEKKR